MEHVLKVNTSELQRIRAALNEHEKSLAIQRNEARRKGETVKGNVLELQRRQADELFRRLFGTK